MATGYDTRQAGRQSFAFSPAKPVQTRSGLSGQQRDARSIGGNSEGRAYFSGPQTDADLSTSVIPEFLAQAMEPYVKRKQEEQFYKGMDAAANGQALSEAKGNSVLNVFGPSYYHQGAAMYQAHTAVDQLALELDKDPELYKLGDDARSKAISERSNALMTGDPVADQLIRARIMETRSSLTASLAKKNYAHGQQVVAQAQSANWQTVAASYQERRRNAYGQAPSADSAASDLAAEQTLLSSAVKPVGQSEENYQAALADNLRNMAQDGNFYAYAAFKRAGLLRYGGPLTDDQIAKAETIYATQAAKAYGEVAFNPEIRRLRMELDRDIAFGDPVTGRFLTGDQIHKRTEVINAAAAGMTGIEDAKYMDASDLQGMERAVTSGEMAAILRKQSRAWQIEDREAGYAHAERVKAAEEAEKQSQVDQLIATGQAGRGQALGVGDAKNYNFRFLQQWQAGDYDTIALNFNASQKVNDPLSDEMKAPITASVGVGYTAGFATAVEQWRGLRDKSPGAAAAYYGDLDKGMERFDRAVRGGSKPIEAWALAFGENVESVRMDLPEGVKRQDVIASVTDSMKADDKWLFGFAGSRVAMNESSRNRVAVEMLPEVAAYMRQTGMSAETAAPRVYSKLLASGRVERVGAFGWVNPPAAKPLATLLGVPDEEADAIVMDYVDTELKRNGFQAGADGEQYTVVRVADQNGKAAMFIHAFGDAGEADDRALWITSDQLRAHRDKRVAAEVQANQPSPDGPAYKPNRLVQKIAQQNKDEKTRYDNIAPRSIPGADIPGRLLEGNKRLIKEQRERYRPNDK
jgi:hypothetical protein